jgi:hypothetical protein
VIVTRVPGGITQKTELAVVGALRKFTAVSV